MRLLVNVVTGPENATRAALGLLVARTAAAEGHEVRVFLGGDGVDLARPETAEAYARGYRRYRELYEHLRQDFRALARTERARGDARTEEA